MEPLRGFGFHLCIQLEIDRNKPFPGFFFICGFSFNSILLVSHTIHFTLSLLSTKTQVRGFNKQSHATEPRSTAIFAAPVGV
ncbi:hypothetical protein L6452_17390 [Arctium lappa]|uniref:Uncharacterized protein n=1 Tax=Arctium lappa TaxID=4217 RepID=A0ACB9C3I5_ARCLA|nr:hypothetical protein L6452_17390 [Arctium lappa]